MAYWREMYGYRSQEFIDGVVAGVTAFAVWDNGKQLVGVQKKPLNDVIRAVQEQLEGDNAKDSAV